MTASSPTPENCAGSRMTATSVTPGATSLSSSSHFPLIAKSNCVKPVVLPPGRDRLATKPRSTGSEVSTKTIGIVARRVLQCAGHGAAKSQQQIRRLFDELHCVASVKLTIAGAPTIIDLQVAAEPPAARIEHRNKYGDFIMSFGIVTPFVGQDADT